MHCGTPIDHNPGNSENIQRGTRGGFLGRFELFCIAVSYRFFCSDSSWFCFVSFIISDLEVFQIPKNLHLFGSIGVARRETQGNQLALRVGANGFLILREMSRASSLQRILSF